MTSRFTADWGTWEEAKLLKYRPLVKVAD